MQIVAEIVSVRLRVWTTFGRPDSLLAQPLRGASLRYAEYPAGKLVEPFVPDHRNACADDKEYRQ